MSQNQLKIDELLDAGRRERQCQNLEGALSAFAAAAEVDPLNRGVQVEIARVLRTLNRLDEADAILGRVFDAAPSHVGALVERGHVRRRRGDYQAAVAAFEAAMEADPNNRNIQVELVRSLLCLDRLDEAEVGRQQHSRRRATSDRSTD